LQSEGRISKGGEAVMRAAPKRVLAGVFYIALEPLTEEITRLVNIVADMWFSRGALQDIRSMKGSQV